ncbi:MAG: hypothetical protein ABH808_00630 [Candidatus Kuenenbacteria bacterium]
MSQALENLKQTVIQANVSEEDKNDLLVFLPIFPADIIEKLTKYFQKEPKLIMEFNKDFKSRLRALTGTTEKDWDRIIKEEEFSKENSEEDDLEEDEMEEN